MDKALHAALKQAAVEWNLRPAHVIELVIADNLSWHDKRTDDMRAHAAAAVGGRKQ